jgi:hypothetical protein
LAAACCIIALVGVGSLISQYGVPAIANLSSGRERAIAIILSGTGSDGSRGIVDVHNAGGLVLVQEEGSAKFTGMPYNAMQSGVVGHSVRPREMPALLQAHLANFDHALERQLNGMPPSPPPGLREVFELLKDDFKIDFSLYRPTTIARRTQRRLLLAPGRDLASYVQLLNDDPIERELLYHDLLIGVTSFFRDDPAFCRLEHELLPPLLESIEDGGEFRAWVAGCASGEEAYSLAILVDEILHRLKKSVTVKIFSTDVHKQSLDAAVKRTGKQIPGKGKATYTKHFLGGVMVFDPVFIEDERGQPYTRENITQWSGMMSSTGEKGKAGGKVVLRHFPDAPTWNATVTFHVMDETVTKDVFTEMLEEAGKFIGLGRFRPQNGGFYGRFAVESVDWQ